eukprot:9425147-Pyramimonas_sp.AAC.1
MESGLWKVLKWSGLLGAYWTTLDSGAFSASVNIRARELNFPVVERLNKGLTTVSSPKSGGACVFPGELNPDPCEFNPDPCEFNPDPGEFNPDPCEFNPVPGEFNPDPGEFNPVPGEPVRGPADCWDGSRVAEPVPRHSERAVDGGHHRDVDLAVQHAGSQAQRPAGGGHRAVLVGGRAVAIRQRRRDRLQAARGRGGAAAVQERGGDAVPLQGRGGRGGRTALPGGGCN